MANDATAFVVIYPHYYGKGATLAAAVKSAKDAGYRHPKGKRTAPAVIYAADCPPEDVDVFGGVGVNLAFPKGATTLRWEQDL